MSKNISMTELVAFLKHQGFVYQGSEIYGGLANAWDYGPMGAELKRNLKNIWWKKLFYRRYCFIIFSPPFIFILLLLYIILYYFIRLV